MSPHMSPAPGAQTSDTGGGAGATKCGRITQPNIGEVHKHQTLLQGGTALQGKWDKYLDKTARGLRFKMAIFK